jgi:hypothetical protein
MLTGPYVCQRHCKVNYRAFVVTHHRTKRWYWRGGHWCWARVLWSWADRFGRSIRARAHTASKIWAHAPLASAARFQIRYAYPISPDCHQLYIVTVANGCGYKQGPFWLPWRIALVGQGDQIEDVRFLFSPLTTPPLWPPKREYNAVSAERSMKFSNIVREETSCYLTKITTCRVSTAKSRSRGRGGTPLLWNSWTEP